jgi:ribonuclease-3
LISIGGEHAQKGKSTGGDAFEAIIGAIYLDKGYEFTRKIFINRILNVHFDIDQLVETEISFKSLIIEWAQKEKHEITFPVLKEQGEKHKKQYIVGVEIDGVIASQSQDYSIKGAERLAAEKAWLNLQEKQ